MAMPLDTALRPWAQSKALSASQIAPQIETELSDKNVCFSLFCPAQRTKSNI